MSRREVVISGRDAGLGTVMDKLRRSSKELGRSLIEEGLQTSKNSKDAVRFYEDQIRLIEKKNRVYSEGLRQQAQENLQSRGSGPKSVKTYREEIGTINRESKQDHIQVELLRELIDTVKHTSLQEIRSDTSNTETRNNLIKRTSAVQGQEFGELQRRMISESDDPKTSSLPGNLTAGLHGVMGAAGQNSFLGVGASGLQSLGGMDKMKDGKMGALGKLGIVGMVLAAVKGIVQFPLAKRGHAETSLSDYASMIGGDVGAIESTGIGRTHIGGWGPQRLNVNREGYIGYLTQMTKARGTGTGGDAYTWRAMEMMRGTGVGMGTIMGAARYGQIAGGGDATSMAGQLYGGMRETGVFGDTGKNLARMSGFLETLVRLQEGQLMGTGALGSNANVNLMSRFASLGGKFIRPEYTGATIDALNTGLKQGGTAESQAIKMSILRQLNPNKSYFELQAEMQKGVTSEGYAEGVMNFVKGTGGSMDSQMILFQQLLGGQMSPGRILSMFKGGMSLEGLEGDPSGGGFQDMVRGRAVAASSKAQTTVDMQSEIITDAVADFGKHIQKGVEALDRISNIFSSDNKTSNVPGLLNPGANAYWLSKITNPHQ